MAGKSPCLKPGRLADVLAALQIMAAGQRPEGTIDHWADQLAGWHPEEQIARWMAVFNDHPEFFLVYNLQNDPVRKAALRWRYANKLYDSKTETKYTQEEKEKLNKQQRDQLTSPPLDPDAISVLLKTAIDLHSRAIDELNARRSWVAPALAFMGAIFGAILGFASAYLGMHK